MAITSTDILTYLSGGAANADPNAALGGVISTTEITDNTTHNLFDKITGAQALAGDTNYRAFFVKNEHATLTYQDAKIYLYSNTPSADTVVTIALADETGSPIETIADEDTAPTGPSFSAAATEGAALSIGDLAPGEVKGIWIKRVVTAGATAYADDNVVAKVFGDTNA
jgi:hypothetical protein